MSTNLNEYCPNCRKRQSWHHKLTQDQGPLGIVISPGQWGCPWCSYVLGCGGESWRYDHHPADDYTFGGVRVLRAVYVWCAMAAATVGVSWRGFRPLPPAVHKIELSAGVRAKYFGRCYIHGDCVEFLFSHQLQPGNDIYACAACLGSADAATR